MLRRIVYAVVGLLVVAALAWALWPKPLTVETAAIGKRSLEISVDEEGVSRIRNVYTISAPTSGTLLRPAIKVGDPVIANATILASIKPLPPALLDERARQTAEAARESAQAAVDLASSQLRQAQAQSSYLEGQLTRAASLMEHGAISDQAFQKASVDAAVARTAIESARASLVVSQGQLKSAEAALVQVQLAEGEARSGAVSNNPSACCVDVRSPVSGTVLKLVTESEQVTPAGTPLVDIGDPADLEIDVDLLSTDAVQVKPGVPATIDGWGGGVLHAEVVRIDPAAITKVSALGIEEQRVTVILKLLDPPSAYRRLGHHFRVVAHVVVWHGDDLTVVPVGALFRHGADWAVFVVDGGAAHLRQIEIGQRNADYAAVVSGLDPGARVIVHPSDRITDGTAVAETP